jgi:hypothetical protein
MNEDRYLLDANVLSRLTADQRASAFVSERCRVPSDVMYEVRGLTDLAAISRIELPIDPKTLERLRDVMTSIAPEDRSLVDLYRNKGAADPVIVAAALVADYGEDQLWQTQWHIVSDDGAVRATASTFGVPWISRAELVTLIEDDDLSSLPAADRNDLLMKP